jgi:uncharacterized protein
VNAIDVRDLLEHPGSSRSVRVAGQVEGLRTELADVPDDAPLEGELVLESVVDGIYVHGSVHGRMRLRCARCLKEFESTFDVPVAELFAREPGDDDYALAADEILDPEPMVRDAVVLEMPFSPLHSPDCKGICPICGGDRNLGECPGHDEVDPRWSALAGLELPDLDADGPDARAAGSEG